MSELQNNIEDCEQKALAALLLHGWSPTAAREFIDAITYAAVLKVADLQRRALNTSTK